MVGLSLSAGGAKAFGMEQEIQFFRDANISPEWLLPLGVLQIIGGLFAVYSRTRKAATLIVAIGFLISTFVIFRTGNSEFALVSLAPLLLCSFVFWRSDSTQRALKT